MEIYWKLPTVATWQSNTFWHFILSVHMFHSLKCHWESGCTFIKRVCHFRTRFVILYLTSSLTEVSGCNPDSEIVKSSQWAHVFSRSCGLVSYSASQRKCWRAGIWYCGSILISGVYLPKFFWSCTWAVLSLSFSPSGLRCHLWEPTDCWGLFSIMRGKKWKTQAFLVFFSFPGTFIAF